MKFLRFTPLLPRERPHINHGAKCNLIIKDKSQMPTPFMSKIKPIQTFMELLLNKDLKDTYMREKVNTTVILNHMLK